MKWPYVLPFLFGCLFGGCELQKRGLDENQIFSMKLSKSYAIASARLEYKGKPLFIIGYDLNRNGKLDAVAHFKILGSSFEDVFKIRDEAFFYAEDSDEDGFFEILRFDTDGNKTLESVIKQKNFNAQGGISS